MQNSNKKKPVQLFGLLTKVVGS